MVQVAQIGGRGGGGNSGNARKKKNFLHEGFPYLLLDFAESGETGASSKTSHFECLT